MLPGVAPTNFQVEVPLLAIVRFRGDRLAHEHICWDQASVLKQIGLLPDASLPVFGVETGARCSIQKPITRSSRPGLISLLPDRRLYGLNLLLCFRKLPGASVLGVNSAARTGEAYDSRPVVSIGNSD
jgi:hypothetical protein